MTVVYHDQQPNFKIPSHWKRDNEFEAYDVNEQNISWREGVDQGSRYQLISKYEQHYGILARICRVLYGGLLWLWATATFNFKSHRASIDSLFFDSIEKTHFIKGIKSADVYVNMTGNPAHMGHMQMIALAINRLIKEGYEVGKVKIALSEEQYLKTKVFYHNQSIERHNKDPQETPEMFKVLIPREKRILFLRAAIEEARNCKFFDQHLDIDYFDHQNNPEKGSQDRKTFHVCGVDFAEETTDLLNVNGVQGRVKHALIVTRDGRVPTGISEAHTNNYSRLIVNNTHKTSTYSSSKIQNGAYEQLPESVREDFKKLHEAAQTKERLAAHNSAS